ncbi:MAG: peptide ABC transporter permease [Bdellovibrionaceae bacterium]|nr:peptide ABC transporter permease [Pseudobdellovibrionaceae bacterium]|tara:strand:- start:108518 stop:109432 length:915 start_codon:yes stop_codon:yes gene_type:complete
MGSVNVSTHTIPVAEEGAKANRNSLWWDAYYRLKKDRIAVISFWVIVFYVLLAVGCRIGLLFPHFAETNDALSYAAPNANHWLGTDFLGRDVLARAAHGTYTSLLVGFFGSGLAVVIGTMFGALAGYFGGKVDDLIVWLYTTVSTIPYILLVIAFSFVLGAGLKVLCLVLGLTGWVGICRVVRGEYMKHRDREYVQACTAIGASHFRKAFIHILPNVTHLILIQFSLGFVGVIKAEVILSYLGLGVEAGTPSWGVMINDAAQELPREVWWGLAAATGFMFFLVLAFNLFNDALRDALDPKLKNK